MTPIIPDSAGPSICDDRPVTATFLIVGEALTDIVVDAGGNRREHPGGSPLNVAVALGRLGHRCHLLTHIGCDERGDAIRDHLAESHVVLTAASTGDHPTSTAAATLDASGAATYEFDLTWDPDPAGLPEQVQAVHASSIAAVLDPGARTVTEVLRRCRATSTISSDPNERPTLVGTRAAVLDPGARTVTEVLRRCRATSTISYDPNVRPALMGTRAAVRERVEANIALSDVVKASDEDIAWLYDTDDLEDVVASWRELGPGLTVMTRGAEGAVGFSSGGRVQVAPVVVDAVDTVGAGDTFSAGILDALAARGLLGAAQREELHAMPADDVATVLRRASGLAAITVS